MSFIEELWIAKDGICLFHKFWTDKPVDLNIQLFSAFTTAVSTFSRSSFPSQPLRSIDFLNTRFLFEFVEIETMNVLVIIKFSTETIVERQLQFLKSFITDLKLFINEFNLRELFINQNTSRCSKPLSDFNLPLSKFVNGFLDKLYENETKMRRVYSLSVVKYIHSLNQTFGQLISDTSFSGSNFDLVMSKNYFDSLNFNMNRLTPLIYDLILKLELGSIEIDKLPDFSYKEMKYFVKDFIGYFANLFKKASEEIPGNFRREVFKSYTENFKVIKFFELDEVITNDLLPIFY